MKDIYSVGQVNRYIRGMFRQDILLQGIMVRGEVSNVKYHSSGHIYFSLKDQTGTLQCILFASYRRGLSFPMKNGDNVVCSGSVDVYEKGGSYQLYVREIRLEGTGLLYQKFIELKKELEEMGMFDRRYKKPVPKYAMRVGVVTAPTGAAIRDIQNISARRNPYVQIYLYPALVQGDGAAASIVRGIRTLDAFGVDVMIVGRGGGSIEDLWAFNEEEVARAVFACKTPIISAVGHETDTTIIDYVADLRAPTPSAAAELAVFDYGKFLTDMEMFHAAMNRSMGRRLVAVRGSLERYRLVLANAPKKRLVEAKGSLRYYSARLAARSPSSLINERRRFLADSQVVMEEAVARKIRNLRQQLERHSSELSREEMAILHDRKLKFGALIGRFQGLNPLDRLRQGYSYVCDTEGNNVRRIGDVGPGDEIRVVVTDGSILAEVRETAEE
ncbi:MAG: exodeoxyribonuclease VII large subunit [Lachnospiraceae bacterium]|nr:exodeoxyribonuclease VII large subunit [Lachnospiraceae bacterium]